jgi:hypothetical protein
MRHIGNGKSIPIGRATIAAVLASIMLLPNLARAEPPDPCTMKVPRALAEILAQRFPGYQLPKLRDQSQEDR